MHGQPARAALHHKRLHRRRLARVARPRPPRQVTRGLPPVRGGREHRLAGAARIVAQQLPERAREGNRGLARVQHVRDDDDVGGGEISGQIRGRVVAEREPRDVNLDVSRRYIKRTHVATGEVYRLWVPVRQEERRGDPAGDARVGHQSPAGAAARAEL